LHQCIDNDWSISLTPDEWPGASDDVNLFQHHGAHFGCASLDKGTAASAEAQVTNHVSFAGSFVAPTMVTFAMGAGANANPLLSGKDWEDIPLSGALGVVGTVVYGIVELDQNNTVVKELSFGELEDTFCIKWTSSVEGNETTFHNESGVGGVQSLTYTATIDNDLFPLSDTICSLWVQQSLSTFKFELTVMTTTEAAEVTWRPELEGSAASALAVSSQGMWFLAHVEGWNFEDATNNRLGLDIRTVMNKANYSEPLNENNALFPGVLEVPPEDGDESQVFGRSYAAFSPRAAVTSSAGAINDVAVVEVDIIASRSEDKDQVGNVVLETSLGAYFGNDWSKTTVQRSILALHDSGSVRMAEFEFAAGAGPYPLRYTPTCDDKIENGAETGIDCGGSCLFSCPAACHDGSTPSRYCESCTDGKKNGDETATDCGGVLCGSCATATTTAAPGSTSAPASTDDESKDDGWPLWQILLAIFIPLALCCCILCLLGTLLAQSRKNKTQAERHSRRSTRRGTARPRGSRSATGDAGFTGTYPGDPYSSTTELSRKPAF
jgi:hypothetical protein